MAYIPKSRQACKIRFLKKCWCTDDLYGIRNLTLRARVMILREERFHLTKAHYFYQTRSFRWPSDKFSRVANFATSCLHAREHVINCATPRPPPQFDSH